MQTRVAKSEEEAVDLAQKDRRRGRAQSLFRNDHAQKRRGWREVEFAWREPPSVARIARSKNRCASTAVPEAFLGVTVQPMIAADGYELILGSSIDPQFGPVLLFGAGGYFVEVFKDRALGLPAAQSHAGAALDGANADLQRAQKGVRGRSAIDLAALEELLVRFSQLVIEQRWIKEIDINPLVVSPKQIVALDARVVLHDAVHAGERFAAIDHPTVSDRVRHDAEKSAVLK